ncbi:unnamed protein product [Urochloa decumbens]|uniref:DUF7378 domain-containing protein n=1 Tax=Urochloa decumbens TaxID=240449 RepID=A0ABC8ZIK0_9POAL
MPTAPPLTIGEARPNVPRARIFIGTALLVSGIFGFGFLVMRVCLLPSNPLLLACSPWVLPMWTLYGVYMSLALVVRSYANLYLPRTPVAVDEAIIYVGFLGIGIGVLMPMEVVVVVVPVEDQRIVMACTGVAAAFVGGMLAFWVCLHRRYGGPAADKPTDAKAAKAGILSKNCYKNICSH